MHTQAHTPAPWHIAPSIGFPLSIQSGGELVADCSNHRLPGESLANARLLSAAPDLLAHLKMLVFGISEGVDIPRDGAAVNAARAAIAKAEGREG